MSGFKLPFMLQNIPYGVCLLRKDTVLHLAFRYCVLFLTINCRVASTTISAQVRHQHFGDFHHGHPMPSDEKHPAIVIVPTGLGYFLVWHGMMCTFGDGDV